MIVIKSKIVHSRGKQDHFFFDFLRRDIRHGAQLLQDTAVGGDDPLNAQGEDEGAVEGVGDERSVWWGVAMVIYFVRVTAFVKHGGVLVSLAVDNEDESLLRSGWFFFCQPLSLLQVLNFLLLLHV